MRKILYILLATMVATMVATSVASCKTTTKVVTMHDTLTIERSVMQEVIKRDTLYKHDTTNVEIERVIYDTCERIKEVQRVVYRSGKIESRGETENVVVHDTITIQQGQQATGKTTPTHSNVPAILLAVVLVGIIGYIGFKVNK